jgi:hypothetical protein
MNRWSRCSLTFCALDFEPVIDVMEIRHSLNLLIQQLFNDHVLPDLRSDPESSVWTTEHLQPYIAIWNTKLDTLLRTMATDQKSAAVVGEAHEKLAYKLAKPIDARTTGAQEAASEVSAALRIPSGQQPQRMSVHGYGEDPFQTRSIDGQMGERGNDSFFDDSFLFSSDY